METHSEERDQITPPPVLKNEKEKKKKRFFRVNETDDMHGSIFQREVWAVDGLTANVFCM